MKYYFVVDEQRERYFIKSLYLQLPLFSFKPLGYLIITQKFIFQLEKQAKHMIYISKALPVSFKPPRKYFPCVTELRIHVKLLKDNTQYSLVVLHPKHETVDASCTQ